MKWLTHPALTRIFVGSSPTASAIILISSHVDRGVRYRALLIPSYKYCLPGNNL